MTDGFTYNVATDEAWENNPWDWGIVVAPDGELIPPGACDGFHNKDKQRDTQ